MPQRSLTLGLGFDGAVLVVGVKSNSGVVTR